MLIKILILILLIIVNGIFSSTEIAFLSLNKYKLSKEVKNGNKKAKKIVNLLNDSSTFLSAIQVAITLSGFLASAFAADSFASEIAEYVHIPYISEAMQTNILIVIITIILSYFTLVFGELLPKKIGIANPEKIAYKMVNIINFVIAIFKPFILVLKLSTNAFEKLLKISPPKDETEDEIKDTIVDSNLEELEKKLLLRVFEFNDITIKNIMTKRENVVYIDTADSNETIISKIRESKYTRFPVMEGEKILGIINIKDLILGKDKEFSLYRYLRTVKILDSDTIIDDAFLILNGAYESMAIVKEDNKYIGIVTIEDILEEIVGNIFDEYDINEKTN